VAGQTNLAGSSILAGSSFADDMQLALGDRLAIYSTRHLDEFRRSIRQDQENPSAILPDDFTIRGIFQLGYYEYDANFLVTSLENAQDLLDLEDRVHGLMIMVDDPMLAGRIRQELEQSLGPEFDIVTWMDNSSLLDAVVVEKKVMFIVLFFITIVAAFGIMNSLITFVVNKTREIGLLKTLGASHAQVFGLFLTQSLLVGVSGVAIGCVCGLLGLAYRNEFLDFMRDWTRLELFPASVYGFTQLPALTQVSDIVWICGSALAACLVAAILPVRIAVRLKPIDALRHE
jgi:lipoprotein-releasing system permease protein